MSGYRSIMTRPLSAIALACALASCATTGTHLGYIAPPAEATAAVRTTVTLIYPQGVPLRTAIDVYQEGERIGEVKPSDYLTWETTVPSDGRLFIGVKGNGNDLTVVRPRAGEPTYLKVVINYDEPIASVRLEPVDAAEAVAFVRGGRDRRDG